MSMTAAIESAPLTPATAPALPPPANENTASSSAAGAPAAPWRLTPPPAAVDAEALMAITDQPDETARGDTQAAEPTPASLQSTARPARRRLFRMERTEGWTLASVAAISFSLTFVAGGVALLTGLAPRSFASLQPPVDLGVLMLIVPVCALVLAMLAEVTRAALTGLPRVQPQRLTPALSDWRPVRRRG